MYRVERVDGIYDQERGEGVNVHLDLESLKHLVLLCERGGRCYADQLRGVVGPLTRYSREPSCREGAVAED